VNQRQKELRDKVNAELKRPALAGLIPERGKYITNGLSSGSMMLNLALSGTPLIGYVWGRIVEIYGPEQGGKTTMALHAIREAQRLEESSKKPIPCLFVDAENALDTYYAECLGIDLDNLSITQQECGEDALDSVETAIKMGFKVIVVDSVSALTPRAEVQGEMGESHMGLQARMMSQAMRKLNPVVSKSQAIVIFINQIRMKIGIMFGNPETTSGGNALKFYATYRLEVRSPRSGKKTGKTLMGYENEESSEIGTVSNIKVVKNKVFPPFRKASVPIVYGSGIDKVADIISFLEYSKAFHKPKGPNGGKIKGEVIKIACKNRSYTSSGLAKILSEPEVQKEILELIRKKEQERND
jgi:recombination protein RecA